ncbi:hypothetical protein PTKIN_Ptkin07bG0066000 [Pterospermum kingtungense]
MTANTLTNDTACAHTILSSLVVRLLVLLTIKAGTIIQPFKLWDNRRGTKASFMSTFVLNIKPLTFPTGGLALILTEQIPLSENSGGQWLGIINNITIGLINIVGVEFDTRKSYVEDIDHNHTGIDHLDLSGYLPEVVYVGFSASTGVDACQLNRIKSWNFTSFETSQKESANHMWIWILVTAQKRVSGRRRSRDRAKNSKLINGSAEVAFKGTQICHKQFQFDEQSLGREDLARSQFYWEYSSQELRKLIGWCYESDELLLVYEFMPNGSLEMLISWNETTAIKDSTLTWERRHNIICGLAQALDYLHNGCEKRVLHLDIKASNIMLDLDFNARLGDFGLARVIQLNKNTHHPTKEMVGTPGYIALESSHTGRATVETDVYAFGVLMLEIMSGRRRGHQCEEITTTTTLWIGFGRITGWIGPREAEPAEVAVEKPAFMWPVLASLKEEGCSLSGGQLTAATELSGRRHSCLHNPF